MNLDFLVPAADTGAVARSPMERLAGRRGRPLRGARRLERGRRVPGARPGGGDTVAWADVSHLRKLELQGARAPSTPPRARSCRSAPRVRRDDAWWCRLTPAPAPWSSAPRPALHGADAVDALDVTTQLRRADADRPAGPRDVRPVLRAGPAPARHAGQRAAPGLDRPPAGDPHPRGRGAATCSCSDGPRASTCGRSWPTPPAHLGGGPVGADASPAPRWPSVLDIFRKRRMWRRQPELKSSL